MREEYKRIKNDENQTNNTDRRKAHTHTHRHAPARTIIKTKELHNQTKQLFG